MKANMLFPLILALAAAASAAPVNLAIHKQAAQSSTFNNDPVYAASKGVDGGKSDDAMFHTNNDPEGPWWEVDLGAEYAIENVTLYNRVGCCQDRVKGLQVLLSSDATNYMLVYTNDNSIFRNRRVDVGGLKARFVRVRLPYQGYLHLQEVEVYQYGTWLPSTSPARWTPVVITRSTPQPTPIPGLAAAIDGRWSVNFNGFRGTMEFTRAGNGWTGSLNLSGGSNEPLTNIAFNPANGSISFVRPSVNQHYSGTVSGNAMSGRFDNSYNWSATRLTGTVVNPTPTPQPSPIPGLAAAIDGRWSVNFNGFRGTMEFTRAGNGWTGTLNLGSGNEPLTNIAFNPANGSISFLRPNVNQHYSGTLSGNAMSGRFDNSYNWSATRLTGTVVTPTPQPTPTPGPAAAIDGRWSVNFNGFRGAMEFTRAGNGWTGTLNLGSGNEPLTNIAFNPANGSISFLRPSVNQHYSGTVSGNAMSGRFDNSYNWSATR